jgi:spore coat protein A
MKVSFTKRRGSSVFFGALLALLALCAWGVTGALAQQVPLNSTKIPQFIDPLPLLDLQGGPIETVSASSATITMEEFQANVMPSTFVPAAGTYTGTWVWGYRNGAAPAPAETYIGPVVVASRGTPTEITWVNNLGDTANTNVTVWPASIDQTLHWADPNGMMGSLLNYTGPIPAVTHLHGGEVPPVLDGGPDAWCLSNYQNGYNMRGHAFYSKGLQFAKQNFAIYNYPNSQEAANIWFHDNVLGATRLNVYAGLAGAYIITDNTDNPLPSDLGNPGTIIPLVIQDRMFDTNGQLYFSNMGINPTVHPFWVPEFVGDTIVVNGKVWPFLEIGPNRYRFLVLNGSNARAYTLDFKIQGKGKSPTFWVIGTDGGYLDAPVPVAQLTVMPGERYDVIVDFAGFGTGTTLLLQNTARTPFPGGAPVNRNTTGRIMEFRVVAAPTAPTTSYDPNPANATLVLRLLSLLRLLPLL